MGARPDAQRSGLLRAASRAYLGAVAVIAAVSLCLIWLLRLETLFRDGWTTQYDFFTLPLHEVLWKDQGGHRVVVSNLLFQLDRGLFSGTGSLLVAASIACKLGVAALLCESLRRDGGAGPTAVRFLAGLVLFAVFWLGDRVLIGWDIAVMTSIAQVAVIGSLWCLAHGAVAASLALGVIATYSFGSGAAVWPALLAVAFWMRLGPRVLAAITATAGLAVFVYTQGLGSAGPTPLRALEQGWDLAVYVASLLGSLVYHAIAFRDTGITVRSLAPGDAALVAARIAGFAGLLLTGVSAVRFSLPGARPSRLQVLSGGILLFCVAVCGVIAAGRFGKIPDRFPLLSALDVRYVSWSLLFWMGAVLLLASRLPRSPRLGQGLAGACAVLLTLFLLPAHVSGALALRSRQLEVREAGLSLAVGALDPRARAVLYRRDELFDPVTAELRKRGWNFFSLPLPSLMGKNLGETFRVESSYGGRGAATRIERLPRGWRIQGWAWDEPADRRPSGVVVSDRDGTIRGLATLARGPVGDLPALGIYRQNRMLSALRRVSHDLPGRLGVDFAWHGYVADVSPAEMSFFAVAHDGSTAFRIDSSRVGAPRDRSGAAGH